METKSDRPGFFTRLAVVSAFDWIKPPSAGSKAEDTLHLSIGKGEPRIVCAFGQERSRSHLYREINALIFSTAFHFGKWFKQEFGVSTFEYTHARAPTQFLI